MPQQPIAVSMGEPAGIGGDISLKAWTVRNHRSVPAFFMIDDPQRLEALARRLGLKLPLQTIASPAEAAAVFNDALPILPQALPVHSVPGVIEPQNASAVISSITRAAEFVIAGEACALVTNPVQKSALYQAGFKYPGHTEFLAHLCKDQCGMKEAPTPVMMLAVDDLRAVPATIHIPLSQVAGALSEDLIKNLLTILADALRNDFAIPNPRIAVAGLNPHAGEEGALGGEEVRIIKPAVDALRASGLNVTGPYPADTLFHPHARANYDAVLAMYHDQALIPIKTVDFDRGVNITLGLPIVRTSPDHGTALDLAGTGKASPASFIEALYTARFIADIHEQRETL